MEDRLWIRQRVQAGRLVKELWRTPCRLERGDGAEIREGKLWFRKQTALNSGLADRVELRLALMGVDVAHYVCSFDERHLPEHYQAVARYVSSFVKRCQRDRLRRGLSPEYDYIRCIEGNHGDARWHLHFCCRAEDWTLEDVARLWRGGLVEQWPGFHQRDGWAGLAKYLIKERADGVRKPLDRQSITWARSLRLPPVELNTVRAGRIFVPGDARILDGPTAYSSQYGSYQRVKYLAGSS